MKKIQITVLNALMYASFALGLVWSHMGSHGRNTPQSCVFSQGRTIRVSKNRSVVTMSFDHVLGPSNSQKDVFTLVKCELPYRTVIYTYEPWVNDTPSHVLQSSEPARFSTLLCVILLILRTLVTASIDSVLNGYNATIFAYGQTGTGKVNLPMYRLELREMCGVVLTLTAYRKCVIHIKARKWGLS